jgi:hypothetical protein
MATASLLSMSTPTQQTVSNLVPFTCTTCDRLYVVAYTGPKPDNAPECKCGRVLVAGDLSPGLYELSSVIQAQPIPTARGEAPSDADHPIAREADIGYGASHGYTPTHGGPSGPGDAPATEALPEPQAGPPERVKSPHPASAKTD